VLSKSPISCVIALFSFLMLSPTWEIKAQQQQIQFERLSIEQGLSQSSVFSITQDQKGFLWFATQDGLNKYDGYSFTHYEHEDDDSASLSDNYVTVLLDDHTGTLWAGTRGGGLDRFLTRPGRFARYRFEPANVHSLSNDEVRCLYEDRSGNLWIGTTNGLNRYDRRSDSFVQYVHNPSDPRSIPAGLVQSLFEDRDGNFWVGMLGALARMDRGNGDFVTVKLPTPGILCVALEQDNNGDLWVAMQNGLYLYRKGLWIPASKELRVPSTLLARVLLKDRNGSVWFGEDSGLDLYDDRTGTVSSYHNDPANPRSLSGNSILSLFEDREGIVWIGTYDGINKYAPAQFKFRNVKWGLGQAPGIGWNKIRSFCEDASGKIWVATQGGLMTYDRRTNTLSRVPNDSWYTPSNNLRLLWSLLEDHFGGRPTIWVGTNGQGLIRLVPNSSGAYTYTKYLPRGGDPHSLSGPSPVALYETRDGTVWVGALWEGLNRFNRKTGTFTRFVHDPADSHSISGNEIWTMCQDRSGFLWVGTGGEGLNRLDVAKGTFTRYRHDPKDAGSLSDDKVTAIVEDRAGILWVGTYAGLNRLDPSTGVFRHFSTHDGLPDNVIYSIIDDRAGNLWLSTNNGLSRFTIRTGMFRNYDAGDGLQSNEFNHGAAFRCRDGEILFGGVNGFNVFSPENLAEDTNIPAVVLTDFKVFNKSVLPSPQEQRLTTDISDAEFLRLSYKDAVLTFNFAALEFTNPTKNRYAYTMEGFDKDWVAAGSKREATYTNLDPGSYVFRVKAANSDGIWNEKGTSIQIVIAPPYWETWWFRLAILLAFLSFGPIVYIRRVNALKRTQTVQQEFSRRLIESQEAERKRVAAELHDSIGQDLLVIKNKLLLGLDSRKDDPTETTDFRDAIDYVSNSLKHVREISRNLRPVQLDQIGLTAALESLIEAVAESSQLRSSASIDNVDNLLSKDGEINLFRIVQESLNNILKHSGAFAIRIELKKTDNVLQLLVEDNGRGMQSDESHQGSQQGLGLSSMQERARILGGQLHIESGPGKGTQVLLKIPIPENKNG
jgi:signal transduction histidine kinase/ligand-binding sensor domain-containing protein